MTPSPSTRRLRPSKMDTVLPTTPSPPTPRLSRMSPVVELAIGWTKKEKRIGLDPPTSSSAYDSGCPYLLGDQTMSAQPQWTLADADASHAVGGSRLTGFSHSTMHRRLRRTLPQLPHFHIQGSKWWLLAFGWIVLIGRETSTVDWDG